MHVQGDIAANRSCPWIDFHATLLVFVDWGTGFPKGIGTMSGSEAAATDSGFGVPRHPSLLSTGYPNNPTSSLVS